MVMTYPCPHQESLICQSIQTLYLGLWRWCREPPSHFARGTFRPYRRTSFPRSRHVHHWAQVGGHARDGDSPSGAGSV